ncbi:hypothetical protein Tco_1560819 [Tanacetum coccineum]
MAKIPTSPIFILNRNKIPNLGPHAGLFVNHHRSLLECDFVSLDSRLESRKYTMDNSFTLDSTEEADNVKILKSCNGLLMCSGSASPTFDYVYNPCTNLKSLDYKVVQVAERPNPDLEIQVYSSETGNWSLCRDRYDIGSREFTIYEMMKGCSVLIVRLGEREDDSFLVINLSGKVVKYNLISKTTGQIFDIGSNQRDDDDDYEFFSPYTVAHNPYEFIPSFASSCNGLILCAGLAWPVFYYVHNPSTNLFKRLPQPRYSHDDSCFYKSVVLRMAFDPKKSFDCKVVQAGRTSCDIEIQIYSPEMGNWSLCRDRFNYFSCDHFDSAIYWNDAFHWLETENRQLKHYKLNIEDHDNPTTVEIPHGLYRGRNFLESFVGSSDE